MNDGREVEEGDNNITSITSQKIEQVGMAGKTKKETPRLKHGTEDLHVVVLLMDRANRDLAVEAFMTRVFLSLPAYLKACSLVCSSWHQFLRRNVWGLTSSKRYLERKLKRNWHLGVPLRQIDLSTEAHSLLCDDHLLLIGGTAQV